jgi:hypothetical protein
MVTDYLSTTAVKMYTPNSRKKSYPQNTPFQVISERGFNQLKSARVIAPDGQVGTIITYRSGIKDQFIPISHKCLTPGFVYKTEVHADSVSVNVKFPHLIDINESQSIELEKRLHHAVENILQDFFVDTTNINQL